MQVIREVGKGGFGVVHEVVDDKGNRFAQKTYCVNQAFTNTPETDALLRPRFLREAKLQSGIAHRNVVPILQKNLEANPPSFLMPLADSTLEKDYQANRSLNGHFLAAMMDIIAALEELHPVKIYHRDLKPGNVLRFADQSDARGYHYAISDFGLVALKQTQVSVLTQVGMKMTSDFYTAPEITSDLGRASPQSDIYSLGCILHDFVGSEDRVPCGEITEKGPYGGILLNCTRRDPNRRFKSVSVLRDVLLDIAANQSPLLTDSGESAGALLAMEAPLTDGQWAIVIDSIARDPKSIDAVNLLRRISIPRIEELFSDHPALANRLARLYSDWIRDGVFNFDDCDGLANRLELIYTLSDLELKAEALMALLYMGTSHNRWYVERKFFSLASTIDELLAKRLAIEFRADDSRVLRAIDHLECSIGVKRENLYPVLATTLSQMRP